MVRANRRVIHAGEYMPMNYSEMGYENLDFALESIDVLEERISEVQEMVERIREMTSNEIEAFVGPDDAESFSDAVYDACDMLDRVRIKLHRIVY